MNGVRLHCVVEGEGPLVLLLHGFPERSHAWRKQILELSRRFRVVAPDLRGYGKSEKPADIASYRTSVLANDIVGLVRAFGEEQAHVVGHDWGGGVAWTTAMLHPDVVDRSRVPSGKIAAPTLLIWGEDDFALGIELTRGMERLFVTAPRAGYLPDTTHWVMEERPEAVNRLLHEFLQG